MRSRNRVVSASLVGLLFSLVAGCSESTDIKLAPAAPTKASEAKPIPKDAKQGGGKSSSGNMSRNPGGNS